MLEIKALTKSFGNKTVLQDINLTFESGKIYGIVGENGAGKTTLFRCIAGLETYEGNITSPYHPIKNYLGYLETNPIFMSYITGWEYLKLLCTAKKIKAENFEEQNVFSLPLNQYATQYSTGMQKKLALMGVLLRKNQIIILDEPFNGVDIQSNMIITELIQELQRLNKTILITSHIFSTLKDICDRIVRLSNGNIIDNVGPDNYDKLEQAMIQNVLRHNAKKIILE